MATGLFGLSPSEVMQQRNEALQAQAQQYAQLDPLQRAASSMYQAGAHLGGAIGGMFGLEDPTMKRATELQQISQQVDLTTFEGMMQGVRMLASKGYNQEAMQLAQKAQEARMSGAKLASEEALTEQRLREKQGADPIQQLLRSGKYKPESVEAYRLSGKISDLDTIDKDVKTEVIDTAEGQKLINSNTGETIANLGKKPLKKSIGTDIAEGLSPLMGAIAGAQAKKAGEAGGTDVGKATAAIQGKYTALNSVADALGVLKKGIYAGGYGPLEEGVAKYSKGLLADKQRLVNTEEFRAYIGDVVIPRLTEFGGNDSVEELKYLRSVMAGDTTLESKSIEKILSNAQKKIQAGIDRIQSQQQAVIGGKPLPIGPIGKPQQRTTRSGLSYTVEGE